MARQGGEGASDRSRASEDEYFRRRDQELIEQTRRRAEEKATLERLAEAAGVKDEDIVRGLQQLGYAAEIVTSFRVLPLIDVAWADGTVSDAERDLVIAAARARGVQPGSLADRHVAQWLASPPSPALCDATLHLLGLTIQRLPPDERAAATGEVLAACRSVATAAGGVLGFHKISEREQRALDRIAAELQRETAPLPPADHRRADRLEESR